MQQHAAFATQQTRGLDYRDRMERQKRKPKQVMVQYRDPETGQMTTQVIDKVVKKRLTTLKKAIIKKRD